MKDYIYFPSSTLNTVHIEREGKTLEDTAQRKCLLAKMTQTHFINVPAEGRWNKILLGLCVVLSNFTIQHRTGGKKPILVNNDLLFIWLIKNAFSSDWWFIYSLFQRGDNYEEFRDFFFQNNSTLAKNLVHRKGIVWSMSEQYSGTVFF